MQSIYVCKVFYIIPNLTYIDAQNIANHYFYHWTFSGGGGGGGGVEVSDATWMTDLPSFVHHVVLQAHFAVTARVFAF